MEPISGVASNHVAALFARGELCSNTGGADRIRVACVGDSITYGNGSHVRKKEREGEGSYPLALAVRLRRATPFAKPSRFIVRNFGNSGKTVTPEKPKWSYRHTKEYQQSLAFVPHIVVVLLGTNDSKPRHWRGRNQFLEDYRTLLDAYRTLPTNPLIVLASPPPVYPTAPATRVWGVDPAIISDAIAVALRDDKTRRELLRNPGNATPPLIDLFAHFSALMEGVNGSPSHKRGGGRLSKYFTDGVHPTVVGHESIADVVFAALCQSNAAA